MISRVTTFAGIVLVASGIWLFEPSHAAAWGVSDRAWLLDAIAGIFLATIGAMARAGQSRN